MVHDVPESVIHSYLTFGNGVADRAIAPPTRARAANRRTTGWLVVKAIAMFTVAVVGSLGAAALELGGVEPDRLCGLVVPSVSCFFFNLQHLLTSWLLLSQWVQCFFPFSFSFSFLLSFVFLEALAKKAVAPIPNSRTWRCSSAKICTFSSIGRGSMIEFANTVFRALREFGSVDMITAAMMLSPSFDPRFRTARTDLRSEFIWGSSGSESVKVLLKISSRYCIFLWMPLPS